MTPQYSYDDFMKAAQGSGLLGEFSQADLDLAQKYPEFGLSILSLKKDYHGSDTPEGKLLANEAANELRKSYGNYSGSTDGSSFISGGKIPGQIDGKLDEIAGYSSFEKPYAKQEQDLLGALMDREAFSWSKDEDPLWPVYKKEYLREGDRATADALGQMSAATGGRPSSYAVGAATQAGDYYATKLNDMIPQLYEAAYQKYLDDHSMNIQDLGVVRQLNQDAKGDWLDQFSVLGEQISTLQGQDAVDYGRMLDKINLGIQKEQEDYQRGQETMALAQDQVAAILSSGGVPSGELLAAAGLTGEYAQGVHAGWQRDQDEKEKSLIQAQVDAMLAAGAVPGAELVAGSGYSNEYIQAINEAWQRDQAEKKAKAAASAPKTGTGSGDYEGLFAAAKASGNPSSYIANNYKRFGFSSSSGLTTDYKAWAEGGKDDAVQAFQNGDQSDETIKALLEAGYTKQDIEAAGYTGSYFKGDEAEIKDPSGQVTNRAKKEWVEVPGMGRMTWAELESHVEDGTVIESYDKATGKYTYTVKGAHGRRGR